MEFKDILNQFENNSKIFENLLLNKTESQYLWRPKPKKWCLLEIVCHLVDEEIFDFRARVKHVLKKPNNPLVPINSEGWVIERNYLSKDYNKMLNIFLDERAKSVEWLKLQEDENWESYLTHPELGKLSAKLFLNNWLAHDYLHIRQILNYQFTMLKEGANVDLSYAGNW